MNNKTLMELIKTRIKSLPKIAHLTGTPMSILTICLWLFSAAIYLFLLVVKFPEYLWANLLLFLFSAYMIWSSFKTHLRWLKSDSEYKKARDKLVVCSAYQYGELLDSPIQGVYMINGDQCFCVGKKPVPCHIIWKKHGEQWLAQELGTTLWVGVLPSEQDPDEMIYRST